MITKETIEKVLDAARIEEVVGDFVDLKKEEPRLLGIVRFIMKRHLPSMFPWQKEFISVLVVGLVVIR